MENQDYIAKLNGTADAWNEWRQKEKIALDLSGLDLMNSRLAGFDLHGTNLRGTGLVGADLTGANLREADLQGVDLTVARRSLQTEQLGGADLAGAKLPDELQKLYEKLDNVNNISESARKLFLGVLGACLYSWLTIATTTDVNLITNRASSPLPIIQTSIPIVGFYVVAPLLVLCVYFYFHFYLQKLWEELGSLPAIFPDGRALHPRIDPWLLNDLIRAHFPKLNVNRPFLSYLQLWISVLLAWWVVPITMFLFWARYLPRQDKIWTTFHVVLLAISMTAALCLYRLAIATLRGVGRRPFRWWGLLTSRRGYQTAAFAVAVGALFGMISWGARWGVPSNTRILGIPLTLYTDNAGEETGYPTWVPRLMALIGYSPFANLENAEVSEKKSTWSKNDKNLDSVLGARLQRANLRYALGKAAFFAGADLSYADLSGADLSDAQLDSADLTHAQLTDASLFDAHLSYADLGVADLRGVVLIGANLRGAKMQNANLNGADLTRTDLVGTDLRSADLTDAYLTGAQLGHADLRRAELGGAELSGADLSGAQLGLADLSGANLQNAALTYSDFRRAHLNLKTVKHALDWDKAFYDDDLLKALKLPPDHNDKLAAQQKKEKTKQDLQETPNPSERNR